MGSLWKINYEERSLLEYSSIRNAIRWRQTTNLADRTLAIHLQALINVCFARFQTAWCCRPTTDDGLEIGNLLPVCRILLMWPASYFFCIILQGTSLEISLTTLSVSTTTARYFIYGINILRRHCYSLWDPGQLCELLHSSKSADRILVQQSTFTMRKAMKQLIDLFSPQLRCAQRSSRNQGGDTGGTLSLSGLSYEYMITGSKWIIHQK